MNNEDIIYQLKSLISEWENEKRDLHDMIKNWENYQDPGSDPGLQYEQETKVEECWNVLSEFCNSHF
jgi:hypothetical protein